MDEHMMAAEIAALKNEIETLKGSIAIHKSVIDTLKQQVKDGRMKVIKELSEWASIEINGYDLYEKLDSMEDKTNV